ncbi:LON peptidase substrate-binding domain-containing protein, partial [Methylophaga sp. UBA678]|uniref:LON peptidase substrate-binding domain-containing protein n=1 Tax=Methylophaga sp. UBA678 TaxID=1946901 RepID=UPI0032E3D905
MKVVPVLPLRDVVVYPYMVIPLFVGRDKSIKALEQATDESKQILLVAQKDSSEDAPDTDGLYETGTLANILQLLKLPDGTVKVLVEGVQRASVAYFTNHETHIEAEVAPFLDEVDDDREADVLMRTLLGQFEQYVKLNKKIPPEVISSLSSIEDVSRMSDTVAAHMTLKLEDKQLLLEMADVKDRIEKLMAFLESEIDIQQIEKRIRNRVKKQMEKSQ